MSLYIKTAASLLKREDGETSWTTCPETLLHLNSYGNTFQKGLFNKLKVIPPTGSKSHNRMKYISCRRNIFRLLERGKWKQNKVLPTGFSPNYSQWGATQLKLPFREKKRKTVLKNDIAIIQRWKKSKYNLKTARGRLFISLLIKSVIDDQWRYIRIIENQIQGASPLDKNDTVQK